jgi:RND family efflux transporter MFP subunit
MRLLNSFATFCSLSMLWACSPQKPELQQVPMPQVDIGQPIRAVINEWDEYTGRFEAVDQVEIRARVSGYLQSVEFSDGQMVNKGDVLFVVDQRPFNIALKSAQSRLKLAEKELKRGRELRNKNSISEEEVDKRTNEFELATAQLDEAELNLEFTQVKAPISGLVGRDLVNPGNLVNGTATSATLLTTIVSVNPIHFYFTAGERDLLKYIRLQQTDKRESSRTKANPVKIKLQDEDEYVHTGFMDFVDNRVDISTGTIQGRAILDNPNGSILPGIFGRMRLLGRKDLNTILIPDSAIGTDQSRKFVYVINEQNILSRKFIEVGNLHTQELRVIESGLSESDQVVVNGLLRARAGATVEPNMVDIASQYTF